MSGSAMGWKRAITGGLVAALLGVSAMATAQALYRWTDADGKTHYGDRPPQGAIGVTQVDTGPDLNTLSAPLAPAPKAAPVASDSLEKVAAPDRATGRRDTRERLQADLNRARESLERAKKKLADGGDMLDDERQVVQQRTGKGPVTSTARQNCRQVLGKDAKITTTCPLSVPNDQYFDRLAKLEDAVRQAEEEVAAAETAYRRGVD